MTIHLTEDRLVKDIVNEFPKTSDVFKRHRIDFCCGGNILWCVQFLISLQIWRF